MAQEGTKARNNFQYEDVWSKNVQNSSLLLENVKTQELNGPATNLRKLQMVDLQVLYVNY